MNDEVVKTAIMQCHVIMDRVNNLSKKQISCRIDALEESFRAENIGDVENTGNIVQDLHNEELHGEMSYISKDGVEGSIGEFGFDSMSEEKMKKILRKAMRRLVAKKILNEMKRTIINGMHMGMIT